MPMEGKMHRPISSLQDTARHSLGILTLPESVQVVCKGDTVPHEHAHCLHSRCTGFGIR